MDHHYDAIIVGGRCAGAATAMLLARGGMRVLVVEAARPGTDTLSTHALMRGGVLQLHRWGLLDAVVDAGTPAIRSTEFAYGDDEVETVDIRPSGGISALYAPRRTVLDPLLLEAARVAGAEVRIPARVTRVLTDGGRVHGVEGIERGDRHSFPCDRAADGWRRRTELDDCAGRRRASPPPGHRIQRAPLRLLPRTPARSLPLGVPAGRNCRCRADQRWLGLRLGRHRQRQVHPAAVGGPRRHLPVAARRSRPGAGPLDRCQHHPSARCAPFRVSPAGSAPRPAQAGRLVGDAGYFKDPITAHGITDALRDAELLARAVLEAPRSRHFQLKALRDYEGTRDRLSEPLFDITERIASYNWDLPELRWHLRELSEAMRPEVDQLLGLDQTPAA